MEGSTQVFVHWTKARNGLRATCRLKGHKKYTTVLPVDASATSIDACILGHFGLRSNTGCCVHDGSMPLSLSGMQPQQYVPPYHPV